MTRNEECMEKLLKIRIMLKEKKLRGVLIKKQANFSWLTAGGRGFIGLASENACGVLLVTLEDAYLVANNIEGPRLIAEELPADIFRLIEVRWWHDGDMLTSLEKEFGTLSDDSVLDQWFKQKRTHLFPSEIKRYKKLGSMAAQDMEKGCRRVEPGMSEQEIAGLISAGLWGNQIEPITLLVAADDRSCQYRHYVPTAKKAEKGFIASVCARRGGLVVSATRIVGFDSHFAEGYRKLLEVERVAFEETRAGNTLKEVFDSIRSAYMDIGFEEEWKKHHQGGMTGYLAREYRADSSGQIAVTASQAFAWNPSLPGAKCEDTILTMPDGTIDILTPCSETWPFVELGGVKRPDVLYV